MNGQLVLFFSLRCRHYPVYERTVRPAAFSCLEFEAYPIRRRGCDACRHATLDLFQCDSISFFSEFLDCGVEALLFVWCHAIYCANVHASWSSEGFETSETLASPFSDPSLKLLSAPSVSTNLAQFADPAYKLPAFFLLLPRGVAYYPWNGPVSPNTFLLDLLFSSRPPACDACPSWS